MVHRLIRSASVATVLLASFVGFALLIGGCGGGEGTPRELTPEDKQNVADEMKGAEDAKKNTEVRVKPSA